MPRDFTSADWKGDTARGARYASEQRARFYDRLEKKRRSQKSFSAKKHDREEQTNEDATAVPEGRLARTQQKSGNETDAREGR